jgi:hypothetical protein
MQILRSILGRSPGAGLRQAGPITVRVVAGDEVRDSIYTTSMPDRIELGYEASIALKSVVASLTLAGAC